MSSSRHLPPKLGRKLMSLLSIYEADHCFSGDCSEEFEERVGERGRRRALLWYWGQVLYAAAAYGRRSFWTGVAMLKNYAKITWRQVRNNKVYSFVNLAGLAIGMACCFLILLWVRDEFSYDRFHEHSADIYSTSPELQGKKYRDNPLALAAALKQSYPEVQKITRVCQDDWIVKYGDRMHKEDGALVDDDFFEIFTFPLLEGDPQSVLEGRDSIVLTEKTAARYFGAGDPVGKTLTLNNRLNLTVTGILQDIPANSSLRFDFLASTRLLGERGETSWSYEAETYALLQKDVVLRDFAEKIRGFLMERDRRTDQEVFLHIQPFSKLHLSSLNGTDPVVYVYIFMSIAVAILLIACINFINLSTARAGTRAGEIGLRKVVGAERLDLIRQFIGESMFLSAAAFAFAVGLVCLLLPVFNRLSGKQMTIDLARDPALLLLTAGILLFTGLASGSYPALLLSSFKPAAVLKKGSSSSGSGGTALRKVLVVSQFAATIILIAGTLVMDKQLHYIQQKDIGLNRDSVVVLRMNRELRKSYRAFKDDLRRSPRVANVTSARNLPTDMHHMNPVYWEGRGPEDYVTMTDASIDYDYFETLGIPILQGRSFSELYATDEKNYILNEEAARITGMDSLLGKLFAVWDDEGKIIGIAKNFHMYSLHTDIGPVVFTLSQRHGGHDVVLVKIKPDDVPGTIAFLKKTSNEFAPNYPFEYSFLDEEFNRQYGDDRRRGEIYRAFTVLAIMISCLGLFGMAAFTAERRIKEIGIRKVLGASIPNIVFLISRDMLGMLCIANLIAWPAAYFFLSRMLNVYAYRVKIDVWTFLVAGLAAVLVALVTAGSKIVGAANSDPVDSLRYE